MKIEYVSQRELKESVLNIIGKYLDLNQYKVFFFGSRVTGKGDERSDIDIGIEGNTEIPLNVITQIKEEIENLPILYKIDIVDFKNTSPEFKEVALQDIEVIN